MQRWLDVHSVEMEVHGVRLWVSRERREEEVRLGQKSHQVTSGVVTAELDCTPFETRWLGLLNQAVVN